MCTAQMAVDCRIRGLRSKVWLVTAYRSGQGRDLVRALFWVYILPPLAVFGAAFCHAEHCENGRWWDLSVILGANTTDIEAFGPIFVPQTARGLKKRRKKVNFSLAFCRLSLYNDTTRKQGFRDKSPQECLFRFFFFDKEYAEELLFSCRYLK